MPRLLAVPNLLAQTTGELRGAIKDPSGAVIVGATVTASMVGGGVERQALTDAKGDYDLPSVPVGTYTVRVQVQGFKTFVQENVEVTIGHVIEVNATLELGRSTQTVTAETSAPSVETTSTQLGAVMNSRAIVDLPLNTRDTYQLLQLQPGVQSQQGYDLFAGTEDAGAVSLNRGRGRAKEVGRALRALCRSLRPTGPRALTRLFTRAVRLAVGRNAQVRRKSHADLRAAIASAPGVDPETVMVVFKETQWENWAFGGGRIIHAA